MVNQGNPGHGLDFYASKTQDEITASAATVADADAVQLNYGFNRITVSAADTDKVVLPPAVAGSVVLIHNADAAQDLVLKGATYTPPLGTEEVTDTVNGAAGGTGDVMPEAILAMAICFTDTEWRVYTVGALI